MGKMVKLAIDKPFHQVYIIVVLREISLAKGGHRGGLNW
jgi:hypothetical protein